MGDPFYFLDVDVPNLDKIPDADSNGSHDVDLSTNDGELADNNVSGSNQEDVGRNVGDEPGGADAEAGISGVGFKEGFGVPSDIPPLHDLIDIPGINANRQLHVLDGQIGKNGQATGGHWLGSDNIQPVPGTADDLGNGVISAEIRIKNPSTGEYIPKSNNGGVSTLFPASWDSRRVISEADFANNNAVRVGNSNIYDGVSPSGVVIRFVKPNGKDAVTFYPRNPQ